jgi:hypothetical protein
LADRPESPHADDVALPDTGVDDGWWRGGGICGSEREGYTCVRRVGRGLTHHGKRWE